VLSETWLKPTDSTYLKDFDVKKDRVDCRGGGGRGIAIMIRNSLKYHLVPVLEYCGEKSETCAVKVRRK